MDGYRILWAEVVLQAREDLASEPRDSLIWAQAEAFFFHHGDWAASRRTIADALELHPDDITRLGRQTLAARDQREPVKPECDPTAGRATAGGKAPPVGLRVETAARPKKLPPERRDRQWWINHFFARRGLERD